MRLELLGKRGRMGRLGRLGTINTDALVTITPPDVSLIKPVTTVSTQSNGVSFINQVSNAINNATDLINDGRAVVDKINNVFSPGSSTAPPAGGSGSGNSDNTQPKDNTMLYVGIGLGVATIAGVIGIAVSKSKKKRSGLGRIRKTRKTKRSPVSRRKSKSRR